MRRWSGSVLLPDPRMLILPVRPRPGEREPLLPAIPDQVVVHEGTAVVRVDLLCGTGGRRRMTSSLSATSDCSRAGSGMTSIQSEHTPVAAGAAGMSPASSSRRGRRHRSPGTRGAGPSSPRTCGPESPGTARAARLHLRVRWRHHRYRRRDRGSRLGGGRGPAVSNIVLLRHDAARLLKVPPARLSRHRTQSERREAVVALHHHFRRMGFGWLGPARYYVLPLTQFIPTAEELLRGGAAGRGGARGRRRTPSGTGTSVCVSDSPVSLSDRADPRIFHPRAEFQGHPLQSAHRIRSA